MVQLDAAQTENLSTALVVARAWAVASGNDPTAVSERVAFAAWTESRGYIYANDGRNTSNSPSVTPEVAGLLRQSLNLPHDKTGSNGRSTGMYQQLSENVGGGWGDMAGTMDPAISTARFLAALVVSSNPVYAGTLLTPDGRRKVSVTLSDPIAADVLRVQRPLADEAESPNYNAAQVAIAREIVAQLSPATPATGADATVTDWITSMVSADQQKQLDDYAAKVDAQENSRNAAANVAWLVENERIEGQPFSRSAATFNDVRELIAKVDALAANFSPATSGVDGREYSVPAFAVSADRKATENAEAIAALSVKIDALGAALDSKK